MFFRASSMLRVWGLVAVIVLGPICWDAPQVFGQRFVDTSPKFAANTAAALRSAGHTSPSQGTFGGGFVSGGFVGGAAWPYGYQVRLAGQNPNFPFSAYGNPRQYGAHDHGFRHVRHPGQAHFNQFGRNHWVVNPIFPCPRICNPVCIQPWPPVCGPVFYPGPFCINPYNAFFPNTFFSPWCSTPFGWGGWGTGGWGTGGFVQRTGFGFAQQNNVFVGQHFARPAMGVFAEPELLLPDGAIADGLMQSRAETVMAQHRAIAEAERGRGNNVQTVGYAVDPLGNPLTRPGEDSNALAGLRTTKEGQEYIDASPASAANSQAAMSAAKRSAIEAAEAKRAARAEAERQRLLDILRQR